MARLDLTYANIYTYVSNYLGLTATGTAPTSTDLSTCEAIVARGLRQFLYPIDERNGKPHEWNFLNRFTSFQTTLNQWKYALPVDFSDLLGTIHFASSELQPPLIKRNKDQILEMRSDVVSTAWPTYFAIVPLMYDLEIGTKYELWLYPNPDQTYVLQYFYRFDPLKPGTSTDILVGGIRANEAILESCLAIAETQEEDGTSQVHQQEARRLVQALVIADTIGDTDKIGNLYQDKDREWPPTRPGLVAYKDGNIYFDNR